MAGGTSPRPAEAKAYRCDGLLVGPFQAAPPYDLLIINTDGSLAERSGNLQWAARDAANRVIARVFERGEGPTASSGTSASAVACAAWRAGWVEAGEVAVVMLGGTAPVRLQVQADTLLSVSLFGAATHQG